MSRATFDMMTDAERERAVDAFHACEPGGAVAELARILRESPCDYDGIAAGLAAVERLVGEDDR